MKTQWLVVLISLHMFSHTVSSALVRPTQVVWALASAYTAEDQDSTETTFERYIGFKVAEKYVNDNDLLSGTRLNFTMVQGISPLVNTSSDELIANLTLLAPFGYAMPDWGSSNVTFQMSNKTLPIISPQTTSGEPSTKAFRNALFLRQPFSAEYLGMLNYALNGAASCSYSAVIGPVYPGIDDLMSNLAAALVTMNQPSPIQIQVSDAIFATNLTAFLREQYFSTAPKLPGCAFVIGLTPQVTGYIDALWGDARLNRETTYFFAASALSAIFLNSSEYGTAPYANLRVVYSAPDVTDSTIPSVDSFQRHLAAFRDANETLPPQLVSAVTASRLNQSIQTQGNTISAYEAYMAGRFIGEVLRLMPNITSSGFVDAVYERNYVSINETIMGPFSDHCLVNSPTSFPCFCNSGGRTYFVAQVNLTDGRLVAGQPDSVVNDVGLLRTTTPLDICTLTTSNVLNPMNLAFIVDDSILAADPSKQTATSNFILALAGAADYANTAGDIAKFGRFNPLMNLISLSTLNVDEVLFNLSVRSNPYALLGGNLPCRNSGIPSMFRNAVHTDIADPVLTAATEFSHYELQFTPVLADYIHTVVDLAFAADGALFMSTAVTVRVLYGASSSTDAATISNLCTKSLHTYQVSSIIYTDVSSMDATQAGDLAQSAVLQAANQIQTVVLIATLNDTFVSAFLVSLAAHATTSLLTSSQQSSLVVLAGTSELVMYEAKVHLQASAASLPSSTIVYFSSTISEWWVSSSTVFQLVSLFRNTTNVSIIEHPGSIMGGISAIVIYSLTSEITDASATAATLIDVIYSSALISAYGLSYGPIYSANCSADVLRKGSVDRTCQCYKGPHVFYAMTLNDWLAQSSGTVASYTFRMTTCGVQYFPLLTTTSLSTGAIAGIVIAATVAVALAILGFYCCATYGKRDNRVAPKDVNAPFAMMFTDIQSSTSLWARAPEVMGPCVEQHHDLIRVLLKKHQGYEVKTIGDSFMVAFKDAASAVRLSLDLQATFHAATWPREVDQTYQSLAHEAMEEALQDGKVPPSTMQSYWQDDDVYRKCWNGIRVRVGLHWGHGSIKLDPVSQGYDYYGTVVNTAARVEGVGNGGQVLVTKDMYEELERIQYDFSPVFIVPLGPQPLRGLDSPIPLYQLCPLDLNQRTFNPLRLDVEHAIEDESESTNTGESVSQTGDINATSDQILQKLIINKRVPPGFSESVMYCMQFLDVAVSTSSAKYRKELLDHMRRKWHIHHRQKMSQETDEHFALVCKLALVVKLVLALEDARKSNTDTTTTHVRRGGSQVYSFPNTPMIVGTPGAIYRKEPSVAVSNVSDYGPLSPQVPENIRAPQISIFEAANAS